MQLMAQHAEEQAGVTAALTNAVTRLEALAEKVAESGKAIQVQANVCVCIVLPEIDLV